MNAAHNTSSASDNLNALCRALHSFVVEIGTQRDLCIRNRDTTAIHAKGKELGVYRMYERDEKPIKHLRDAAAALPPWKDALLADWEGAEWDRVKAQIDNRVERHTKLETIVSRGVAWKGHPVCIHAYKFEAEPRFKVELEMLGSIAKRPEQSLKILSEALECHDFLIPTVVALPKPPYEKHEAAFYTIDEYLSRNLPSDMYDLYASHIGKISGATDTLKTTRVTL